MSPACLGLEVPHLKSLLDRILLPRRRHNWRT